MSKVFYDQLIALEEIERKIQLTSLSPSEKETLWRIIDEIIHHRILGCVLDNLPVHHHHDFLTRFHQAPSDEKLILYLSERTGKDAEKLIKEEITSLTKELLEEFRGKRKKPKRFLTSQKIGKKNPQKQSARQKKNINKH